MLQKVSQNLEKEKKKETERLLKIDAIQGAKEHIIQEENEDDALEEESEAEIDENNKSNLEGTTVELTLNTIEQSRATLINESETGTPESNQELE